MTHAASGGHHGHRHGHEHEHEFEPQLGLPEPLPSSERMLWQGSPDWKVMAKVVFHVRKVAIYFAVILALRAVFEISDGRTVAEVITSTLWLLPLPVIAIGLLAVMAYLSARTTVYTITDRRLVMRVGIVLTMTFNLPFTRITAASVRRLPDGYGEIPVVLAGPDKVAYVHIWPHARPWHFAQPEPMLRCLPQAERVSKILADAWQARVAQGVAQGEAGRARDAGDTVQATSHSNSAHGNAGTGSDMRAA